MVSSGYYGYPWLSMESMVGNCWYGLAAIDFPTQRVDKNIYACL